MNKKEYLFSMYIKNTYRTMPRIISSSKIIAIRKNLLSNLEGSGKTDIASRGGKIIHMLTSVFMYRSEKTDTVYGNRCGISMKNTDETRLINRKKAIHMLILLGSNLVCGTISKISRETMAVIKANCDVGYEPGIERIYST